MTVNDDPNISASDRFLEFLSHAYRVPFEPGALEDFLASATDCLLYSERNNLPSVDIGNIADLSHKHADHNDRLNKIFDAHTYENLIDPTAKWSKQHSVGNIIVDLTQSTCFGNSVAQEYLGQTLPAQLDDLNLPPDVAQPLAAALKSDPGTDGLAPDYLVQIASTTRPSHIPARISFSHSNRGPIAEITFFRFSWDATSLSEFRDQFDLTKTETDILALILNGKSQSEIADDRCRSLDTIKIQVRSLLKKTSCTKSTELVRQVMWSQILNLALRSNVAEMQGAHTVAVFPTHSDKMTNSDGRVIQINRFGPETGRPVVLVHGLIWGPFVTPALLRLLHRENIHLIAPFRAGFGGTEPPVAWADFDATVVDDYMAVIRHCCTASPLIVVHQGGTSHGCRIAARLGDQTPGLMIVSGGIPIVDVLHLEHMNKMTRIAAVACRYAPSIMETMMRAGMFVWQKRGPEKFLQQALASCPSDLAALLNPKCRTAMVDGALNMISQGSKTAVHDGMAAMADWTADYDAVTCPIKWLHGDDDPIIHPKSIEQFLCTRPAATLTVVPDTGVSLLYAAPEKFIEMLSEFADFNP